MDGITLWVEHSGWLAMHNLGFSTDAFLMNCTNTRGEKVDGWFVQIKDLQTVEELLEEDGITFEEGRGRNY